MRYIRAAKGDVKKELGERWAKEREALKTSGAKPWRAPRADPNVFDKNGVYHPPP